MLSYNLDFNSCAIRDGFRKSSHIYSMPICLVLLVADDDNSTEIAVTVSIHKILFN